MLRQYLHHLHALKIAPRIGLGGQHGVRKQDGVAVLDDTNRFSGGKTFLLLLGLKRRGCFPVDYVVANPDGRIAHELDGSATPDSEAGRPKNLAAAALHVQVKTLHEDLTLARIQPGKSKAHQQAGNTDLAQAASGCRLPGNLQAARINNHLHRRAGTLPVVVAERSGQPAQPFGFGAAHIALKSRCVM